MEAHRRNGQLVLKAVRHGAAGEQPKCSCNSMNLWTATAPTSLIIEGKFASVETDTPKYFAEKILNSKISLAYLDNTKSELQTTS
jgi:hypothetical protein